MQPLFDYILKLSVSLAIVYLFYQLVLRKLTFYNWNRWYLLGYSAFAFLIPLLNITAALDKNNWNQSMLIRYIPVIEVNGQAAASEAIARNWQTLDWLFLLLLAGMGVLIIRFVIRYLSFLKVRRNATLLADGDTRLYMVEKDIIPFSFGNSIFINNQIQDEAELKEIIRHEFVHVKQKHTHDIVWSELLCILNWYNPFAWLIRMAIRQNLEFIADNKVLEQGLDRKKYQYLLLKVTGNNHFSIANQFNFSSLKKRIAMMNKMKSARMQLIKFLFIVPLIAVMLLAFRNERIKDSSQDNPVYSNWQTGEFTDSVPNVEINDKGYYLDIKDRNGECIVVVRDKNRKEIERLPLTKWNESYENKYGEIPPPPPPAPPVPPAAPKLPAYVKSLTINNDEATVLLKDGSVEKYDFNNQKEKKAFHEKYGARLSPPPPPPPPHSGAGHNIAPGTVIDISKGAELSPIGDVTVSVGANIASPVHLITTTPVHGVNPAGYSPTLTLTPVEEIAVAAHPVKNLATTVITGGNVSAPALVLETTPSLTLAPVTATGYGGSNVAVTAHDRRSFTGGEIIMEMTITKNTSRERLNQLEEEAKAKDIKLSFDKTEYNRENVMTKFGARFSKGGSKSEYILTDIKSVRLVVFKENGKYNCDIRVSSEEKEVQ